MSAVVDTLGYVTFLQRLLIFVVALVDNLTHLKLQTLFLAATHIPVQFFHW